MGKSYLIIFIIILVIMAGLAYFLGFQQGAKKAAEDMKATYQELLTKAGEGAVNPMENLPSANPFEEVKVNPFEGIKVNPFK